MEWKQDKQQTVTRLAVCAVIAVILYTVLDKAGDKLSFLDPYRPWLEKNKIQAIAILAAILFGVSLAVLPLEEKPPACPAPEEDVGCDPCEGYDQVL